MGKPVAWKDEYTLLCERCGYVVEGLATDGSCPECGKPIAESLPERRVGTAWQTSLSGSLLKSWRQTLLRPCYSLDSLRIDGSTKPLRMWTIACAAGLGAALWCVWMVRSAQDLTADSRLGRFEFVLSNGVFGGLLWFVALMVALIVLTKIEQVGLRHIGRQRGFRTTPAVARSICDLATAGWVLASLSALVGSICWVIGGLIIQSHDLHDGASSVAYFSGRETFLWIVSWALIWIGVFIAGGGLLVGFLFFETFAWLGLRRLKYANRSRPVPPDGVAID